ncbi:MaoC family dehydratase N-terminal domain-containing protein [Caballeronia sp. LZ065]|uniref:FAS1-like dehydratase domain-containing protein n=1 Tax=Caballeronia sp. LZ065 TaxID=3038571 RepID=UPI003857789E
MNNLAMTNEFEAWIGREEQHEGPISASTARAMAATLGLDAAFADGDALPPGWHWLYFNAMVPRSGLGPDGHPRRGGFLPPIALPRRMWAGSRIRYVSALPVGAHVTKTSRILKVENKTGKRGSLWFVTVLHTLETEGQACIVEEQDIVYREPSSPGSNPAPAPEPHAEQAEWSSTFEPDTTLLFRYSALTFNGHRIHYDQAYAKHDEGYRDLVVHGPLTSTLLQQFALECGGGRQLARFDFRGVNPLFVDRAFALEGRASGDGSVAMWARGPDGELAMSATASFK